MLWPKAFQYLKTENARRITGNNILSHDLYYQERNINTTQIYSDRFKAKHLIQ